MKCPPISKELLDYLEATVPEKCPSITMSEREIWMYVGTRKLVRGLIEQFRNQQDNIMEESVNVLLSTKD